MDTGTLAAMQQAGNAIGNLTNVALSSNLNKKNRKFSEQMADKAWDRDVQMWNMTNEYNTPQAQMKRFSEAGLNPNLIYGQGSAGTASTMSAPKASNPSTSTPKFGPLNFMSTLSQYQDVRVKQAQADNLKEQNGLIKNQALKVLSEIKNTDLSNDNLKLKNKLFNQTFKYQVDAAKAGLDRTNAQAALANIQTAMKKHDYDLYAGTPFPSNAEFQDVAVWQFADKLVNNLADLGIPVPPALVEGIKFVLQGARSKGGIFRMGKSHKGGKSRGKSRGKRTGKSSSIKIK